MSKMRIIYITGLGDSNPVAQRRAVRVWKLYGVKPVFFQVNWSDDESFGDKLARFVTVIDDSYKKSGQKVGLIAASAGVSMALHGYVKRTNKIAGIVSICGKIGRPDYVLDVVRSNNPAFSESMDRLIQSIDAISGADRASILCLSPFTDKVVDLQDQYLDGALRKRVWSFGHVATIVLQLTVGAYRNCRFLRNQLRKT